ncbi:uncharacterized protein LOC135222042 [Macrobrachium nipponense]|uniref:uncharacterized protein LOC135222042 n=1 Tax=Macrobrachium nipponense TaxID=159736 RepID=UPI0030C8828C
MCSFTVKTCCCFLSLGRGLVIFGIIDLIFDLLDLFKIDIYLSEDNFLEINFATVDSFGEDIQNVIALVDIVCSTILLLGVYKVKYYYVMIWWWWSLLQISWMMYFGLEFLDFYPLNAIDIVIACTVTCLFAYRAVIAKSFAVSLQNKSRKLSGSEIYRVV